MMSRLLAKIIVTLFIFGVLGVHSYAFIAGGMPAVKMAGMVYGFVLVGIAFFLLVINAFLTIGDG
jgi:hypothetical protein